MQQDILTAVPTGKVYKINHIIIAGFFGGMFAAAYLLAQNFKTLDNKEKIFSTWVYAFLLFILLGATAFIPELDSVPNVVYSIVITAIIAVFANMQQRIAVEQHIEFQGAVHNGWRVVVVAVIGFLLMLAFVLGAYAMMDMYINDLPNNS